MKAPIYISISYDWKPCGKIKTKSVYLFGILLYKSTKLE